MSIDRTGVGKTVGGDAGERIFLTAAEVGRQLGVRKSRVYELAASGAIPVVRLGRRMLFPRKGLEELAESAVEAAKARLADSPGRIERLF